MAYPPPGGVGGMATSIQGQLLEINVVGCRNLTDKEWFSRQDPYVCIEYATHKFRTRTDTDGGKSPSFNEKFMVPLIEGLGEINASVWNSNSLSYDDLIGSTRILIENVISSGYDDTAWPLKSRSGKFAGELRLIMHYANPSTKPGRAPGGPAGHAHPGQYPQPGYTPAPQYPPQQYPPQPGYLPPGYGAPGPSYHAGYPPAGYPAAPYAAPAAAYPAAAPPYPAAAPGYPPAPGYTPHAPAHPQGYPAPQGVVPYLVAGAAAIGAHGLYSHGKHGPHGKHKHGKFKGKHRMWGKLKRPKFKWK